MRSLQIFITIFFCVLALVSSTALEQAKEINTDAEILLSVDAGAEHSNEGARQARQYYGYYGRPAYSYYVGYGGYYRPYYLGYGYGRPYYSSYGTYLRPYYGGYGGFYG